MTNSDKAAKKILLDDLDKMSKMADIYAESLENGKSGDLHAMSKAIALLIRSNCLRSKMISAIYSTDFVTMEDCARQHASILSSIKGETKNTILDREDIGIKIGPLSINGRVNQFLILVVLNIVCIGGMMFVLGKVAKWW